MRMTETQWLECKEPELMFRFLLWGDGEPSQGQPPLVYSNGGYAGLIGTPPSERRICLYVCACFRTVDWMMEDETFREMLRLVESKADGESINASIKDAIV